MSSFQRKKPSVPFETLGGVPIYDWDQRRGGKGAIMIGSLKLAMHTYTPERRRKTIEQVVSYIRGEKGAKLPPEAKELNMLDEMGLKELELDHIASGNGPKITESATLFFVGRKKGDPPVEEDLRSIDEIIAEEEQYTDSD